MTRLRPYAAPILMIGLQVLVSLIFILGGRLPDPSVVTEWPTGVSTQAMPLWTAGVLTPLLSVVMVAGMAAQIRFPGKKLESWRLRGVHGPAMNLFLLCLLVMHCLSLLNVASRWTLSQGLLQSAGGLLMGGLILALGNYQTKTSSIGLWALTPWRLRSVAARQACQRIAGRLAMACGVLVILSNALLLDSRPIAYFGTLPLHPQLPMTLGLYLLVSALIAVVTWPISRRDKSEADLA